jgi:5-methylcytosine-specific restriction endonuclease McrA
MLCPECDETNEAARQRNNAAKAAGYLSWASTPEYKRLQLEAAAAKENRSLPPYVPKSERHRRGAMLQIERLAGQIRRRWAMEWLEPFRLSEKELYQTDPDFREQVKAEYRSSYARRRMYERGRIKRYKAAHWDRKLAQDDRRTMRLLDHSDGTATGAAIAKLKQEATRCAYCDCTLGEKQTDHMIPLVLGGAHSLRNIVIVCPDCNARKARLDYAEWIERAEPQHRPRVVALFLERFALAAA